ncbi:probable disease resistance protein At1g15890 [Vitis vinifera]|uniref:probable disease resistance protein At1g15890 n=1 Tax=Vitis vinifera TaxID=29760 RepID=UPI0008FEB0A7|nr:probable disease resistance protein At1g15890 [Vitis vinifera]|eukprot:XP_019078977.1 PREDICTED: probable disease resistance protein At1g15890 [Vitis vinifera]
MGIDENPHNKKKVGHYISNRSIRPLAWGVVDECHGLPLLIDRVARTFKKKGENEVLWNDGLKQLKRWDSVKLDDMDEVLERLQICYDDLKDGEENLCFLYGALYLAEREIDVDYLLECWKSEGFINDASNFKSARNRGHSVLNELIKVSLLERSDNSKCVTMNKVLQKMALRISSQNTKSKFLVKPPEEFEDFPKEEEWEQASRISLMGSQQGLLPKTLDCSSLLTLLLRTFAQILESIDHPGHNILKLVNGDDVSPIIMKVLMETNALGLIDYGVSSLLDFSIENMNRISNCLIKGCSKIKTIIDGDRVSEAVLQSLENLHITDVPNLENIWQGPVQARSLSQLTTVTLSKCPKLKMIFSEGMIRQFLRLKHLRVEECCQIEKIIMESKHTQLKNQALPELKTHSTL